MSVEELAPEAMKLPVRERAFLAAFLWESVEDPYTLASGLDDDEAISLAEKRDSELESGEVQPVSHGEVMVRLRSNH